MNKTWTLLAAAVIGLSACAVRPVDPGRPSDPKQPGGSYESPEKGFDSALVAAPAMCFVNVHVVNDEITIDHEPVQGRNCNDSAGGVAIKWRLANASIYSFAANGIEFKAPGPALADCRATGPQVIRCTVIPGHSGRRFGYTINVLKNGAAWKSLDPFFFDN